jgi:uncharacterized protein YndB with AHSA1/START domain
MPSQARPEPSSDHYRLGYRWLIEGPIETVFRYLSDGNSVTQWWPQFKWARMEPETVQIGARLRARVKSLLPYQLHWDAAVSQLEAPRLIQYETQLSLSHRFRLRGWIRYTLRQTRGRVEVLNEQLMTAERPLPRPLRPLAQRLFNFNHRYAMKRGGAGLQEIVRRDLAGQRT